VIQRIQSIIADLIAVDMKARAFKGKTAERNLAVQYIAGAFMAVLMWWIAQDAKLPPQEVDAMFRRLVMEGVAGEWGVRAL
jgi:hypothetical protein